MRLLLADQRANPRFGTRAVKLTDTSTVKRSDSCADEVANSRADNSTAKPTDPYAGMDPRAGACARSLAADGAPSSRRAAR